MSIDFEKLQEDVFIEQNKLRNDPQSYIEKLKDRKSLMKGDVIYRPSDVPIQTYEGNSAIDEAIDYLQNSKDVGSLKYDANLCKAALDLINDIGPKGQVTHEGSNGYYVSERIEQYTEWDVLCSESIQFTGKSAEEILIDLLVDDGIKERAHRFNIFNPHASYVGVGCGVHKMYGTMCVIVYVGKLRDKGSLYFNYDNYKYQYPEDLTRKEKIKNPVNDFQNDDPDAPDTTVSVKISKAQKEYKGKKIIVTKKCYKLSDGTEHIVELEEF